MRLTAFLPFQPKRQLQLHAGMITAFRCPRRYRKIGNKYMKLSLKNIGRLGTVSVEINGITVIAGANNTGKSTVGRALFAVFNSFSNAQRQIENERLSSIENLLNRMFINVNTRFIDMVNTNDVAKSIVANIKSYRHTDVSELQKDIENMLSHDDKSVPVSVDEKNLTETASRIKEVLNISDIEFLNSVLERKLYAEFNAQVSNIFSEENGEIRLGIKDSCITVSVKNEGTVDIYNPDAVSLHTEVIYIDDPFVIDEPSRLFWRDPSVYADHRSHLRRHLLWPDSEVNVFDEIIARDKFKNIFDKLSSVCNGDIIRNKRSGLGYRRQGSDKVLSVRNLSTGLKTFVILKMLLTGGAIENNGTIILDEPEIHLHPEWQLLFAELIVLIQKEFDVHVLLNTHSPYFLEAIEVFSVKYGVDDRCKYYFASVKDDIAVIEDVSDNVETIYKKLFEPFQNLENVRGSL